MIVTNSTNKAVKRLALAATVFMLLVIILVFDSITLIDTTTTPDGVYAGYRMAICGMGVCLVIMIVVMLGLIWYYRKAGEQYQRRADEKLELTLANIRAAVTECLPDADITLRYVSDGFLKMTGYSRQEIEVYFHNRLIDMILPEDARAVSALFAQQSDQGKTVEAEFRLIKRDGLYINIFDSATLISAEDGEKFFYCTMIELPAKQEMLKALKMKSVELETIAENIDVGFVKSYLEADAAVQYVNKKALDYLGYSREEFAVLCQNKMLRFIHPDDLSLAMIQADRLIDTGESLHFEMKTTHRDGTIIWLAGRATCIWDEQNKPVGIFTLQDITEEKQIKATIKQQNEVIKLSREKYKFEKLKYQNLIDSIKGGVVICGSESPYILEYVSDGLCELSGYRREELLGNGLITFIHPDDLTAMQNNIRNQLAEKDEFMVEYRLIRRSGQAIWILENATLSVDTQGKKHLNIVMVDITIQKDLQISLRLSEEKYRIAMEQSDMIVFEYSPIDRTIIFSGDTKKAFGLELIAVDFPQSAIKQGLIFSEDIAAFTTIFEATQEGANVGSSEFRIRNDIGNYRWCLIQLTTVVSDLGKPVKVVGKMTDIDQQKREKQLLEAKVNRDPLTGLLNKLATENQIDQQLICSQPGAVHALFMVDIDDFKGVNDNLGHVFGDAVLVEIATQIKRLFRPVDLMGRVGGDEFIIFVENMADDNAINQKAKLICDIFRKTFTGEKKNYKISGSVGVAVYNKDGNSFAELYHKADQALYATKVRGKDGFAFFDEGEMAKRDQCALKPMPTEINQYPMMPNQSIREYIFDLLCKARDIKGTINLIMDIIGKKYDLSRVYVFENNAEGKNTTNTYEWCNEGITPEIENLQDVPLMRFKNFYNHYGADGVFYCDDVSKLDPALAVFLENQGIQALLHTAIEDDGKMTGYVGFDDCRGYRHWDDEEVDTLTFIGKLIGFFLLKKQASNGLKQSVENKQQAVG